MAKKNKAYQAGMEQAANILEKAKNDWQVALPKDVQNVGTELVVAPTKNPRRPRALSIAYNSTTNTLIVVFRDNTWWQYNNVPVSMWLALKNSDSTGEYLRSSNLDIWPQVDPANTMGPADMDALSNATQVQISDAAKKAYMLNNPNVLLNLTEKEKFFL